jgi:superfamily II DNA helicase RecQ
MKDRAFMLGWLTPVLALLALVVASLAARGAQAVEITWKLSDQEQQQLVSLLDMAAKAGGVRAAPGVTYFVQKLQAAQTKIEPVKPVVPEKK